MQAAAGPHQPQQELAGWPLHAALPLGALPTAPGSGRAWTRQILREWGLDRLSDSIELLVSELTTNALQASASIADAAIGLWLASDWERAVILVWDPSPRPPAPANPGQDAEDSRPWPATRPSPQPSVGVVLPCCTTPGSNAGKVVWAIIG